MYFHFLMFYSEVWQLVDVIFRTKIKNNIIQDYHMIYQFHSRCISKRIETVRHAKNQYMNIHRNILHDIQKVYTTQNVQLMNG